MTKIENMMAKIGYQFYRTFASFRYFFFYFKY